MYDFESECNKEIMAVKSIIDEYPEVELKDKLQERHAQLNRGRGARRGPRLGPRAREVF